MHIWKPHFVLVNLHIFSKVLVAILADISWLMGSKESSSRRGTGIRYDSNLYQEFNYPDQRKVTLFRSLFNVK